MRRYWRLKRDEKGSIAVMAAMALSAVLGMSAFAVEGTQGYVAKVRNQRVADLAALGAAIAYKANPSDSILIASAQSIAAANGLTSTQVTAQKATDPSGKPAIQVTVSTDVPLDLAKAVTSKLSYTVTNTAMASLEANTTPACIVALSGAGTYGVSVTGGTSLSLGGCALSTNSGVSATSGTSITAGSVVAGKSVWDQPTTWGGTPAIRTNPTANQIQQNRANAALDTYGSDARLVAAFARLGRNDTAVTAPVAATAPTGPAALSNPTTPAGADWDFNWSPNATVAAYRDSQNGSSYTVPAGNYTIGKLTVGGGITVKFVGGAGRTITIAGGIQNGGSSLTFGPGNVRINGAINSNSAPMTFGDGSYQIGDGALNLGGTIIFGNGDMSWNGSLALNNGTFRLGTGAHRFTGLSIGSSVSFAMGAGAFSVSGPLTLAGTITLPAGNIAIGKDGSGNSLTINGNVTFGDGNLDILGGLVVSGTMTKGTGYLRTGMVSSGIGINVTGTLNANTGDVDTLGSLSVTGNGTFNKTSGYLRTGKLSNGTGIEVNATFNAGSGNIDTPGSVVIGGAINSTSGSFTTAGNLTVGGSKRLILGPGNFTVAGKVTTAGGSVVTTGAGTQTIGGVSGVALDIAGGTITFGDGAFSANGSVSTTSGGVVNFGVSANHQINGSLSITANATFGAGAYTINGNLSGTASGALSGTGVTFILAGNVTMSGGSRMALTAPTSDAGGGITDIVIATRNAGATLINQGAQNSLTGMFYAPNSAVTLDGGASFSAPSGKCLMMVVSTLTLNGGTSSGTACSSLTGGSTGSGGVALVL